MHVDECIAQLVRPGMHPRRVMRFADLLAQMATVDEFHDNSKLGAVLILEAAIVAHDV